MSRVICRPHHPREAAALLFRLVLVIDRLSFDDATPFLILLFVKYNRAVGWIIDILVEL